MIAESKRGFLFSFFARIKTQDSQFTRPSLRAKAAAAARGVAVPAFFFVDVHIHHSSLYPLKPAQRSRFNFAA
jgi:hypothetical protein